MGKVLVAMSGGVDSSVAALLLLRQGYEVIGATMQMLFEEIYAFSTGCAAFRKSSLRKIILSQPENKVDDMILSINMYYSISLRCFQLFSRFVTHLHRIQ